jgi:hypothetical protein
MTQKETMGDWTPFFLEWQIEPPVGIAEGLLLEEDKLELSGNSRAKY